MKKNLHEATRRQKRFIKRLGIENLVPLNTSPEEVDNRMMFLNWSEQITKNQYFDYFHNARATGCYPPTVLSTIINSIYSFIFN